MRRLAPIAAALLAACSSGDPVVPAVFRGPVAVAPFVGHNPSAPEAGLVPLLAVASIRGDELRIIDPSRDAAVAGPNPAWALSIPTLQRPSRLGSIGLGDGQADLLVVAGSDPLLQIVGTWLDGSAGYGVARTIDLRGAVPAGSQVLSLAVAAIPSGTPTGSPAIAPPTVGSAWVIAGIGQADDPVSGQLLVLQVERQADGSIAPSSAGGMVLKPLGFTPTALAAAPDNVHLYVATQDRIPDGGAGTFGIAEVDTSAGLGAPWPVRAFGARNSGTLTVSAAFVGERIPLNFYTFSPPSLRVYAGLDPSGCGPERDIACGVATFDPAVGGLAADPAAPGPAGWPVPTQSYRTPLYVPGLPIAMGIAPPPANPGPNLPSTPFGSQVCYSPAVQGVALPLCPSVTELANNPPFNNGGAPQKFMLEAPPTGQIWTSVVGMVTAVDGLAYVQDLGRFGPVNAVSMLNDDNTRTQATRASSLGPAGPTGNSAFFGFPAGTAALGLWLDPSLGGTGSVVSTSDKLPGAITVWPGFTRDDGWLVSWQGVLPGLSQRRSVLGLAPDGQSLYLAVQDAAVPSLDGELPAAGYWIPGAIVGTPDLGIHTVAANGLPGDIGQFLLDTDPCPSTRPNWIPSGEVTPVYDPTKAPLAHEARLLALLPPDALRYPGGALQIGPDADATLASEYQCLLQWFQDPANAGMVLTAFRNNPPTNDYARGTWIRAGELLLVGIVTGYAGRPQMDLRYWLAWEPEEGLSGEPLALVRKARRFYYPAAYPTRNYQGYPLMDDPMQPGPVVGFRVGRYCLSGVTGCDATTSLPARDAGVSFFTLSGLAAMSRHPSSTSGGTWVTSFDRSLFSGQEYLGRVFYATFTGDLLMMSPPGLDVGQTISIR